MVVLLLLWLLLLLLLLLKGKLRSACKVGCIVGQFALHVCSLHIATAASDARHLPQSALTLCLLPVSCVTFLRHLVFWHLQTLLSSSCPMGFQDYANSTYAKYQTC